MSEFKKIRVGLAYLDGLESNIPLHFRKMVERLESTKRPQKLPREFVASTLDLAEKELKRKTKGYFYKGGFKKYGKVLAKK